MITLLTTIFKAVFSFVLLCCKIVYRVLKLLRIRILVLYLVVCGLLQLIFHAFDGKMIAFWAGFAVCIVLTLFSWGLHLKRRDGSNLVKRDARELDVPPEPEMPEPEKSKQEPPAAEMKRKAKQKTQRPKYYDVAGKPDYVYAEFEDRYELYRKEERGLSLVRTDYKNNERSGS